MVLRAALALAVAAVLATAPAPATAQVAGRWRVVLSTAPTHVYGDLRLDESDHELSGTLLLETSDSAPVAVSGTVTDDGNLEFATVGPGAQRFAGRVLEQEMFGTLHRGQETAGIAWVAERIDPAAELYIPLPRFTMRQLIVSAGETGAILPGRWVAALETGGLTAGDDLHRYRGLAAATRVPAATEPVLRTTSYLQSMGLMWRDSVLAASGRALETIRAGLPDDSSRARFDFLFQSDGRWLRDIHEVAMARVRRKFPAVTWRAVRPALLVPGVRPGPMPVPGAGGADQWLAYRLFILSQTDSAYYSRLLGDMRALEPEATGALVRLLRSYRQAVEWYPRAIRFLLGARWLDGRSPADLVSEGWRLPGAGGIPEVTTRLYGRPDGAPRSAPPASLVSLMLVGRNWTAGRWLQNHGDRELLELLGRLPPEIDHTVLDAHGTGFDLTSLVQLRRRPSGFMNPADAVVVAPGYNPIMALGTVVHEWVHLLQQKARGIHDYAELRHDAVWLRPPDPFVAEGLAEWYTGVLLRPVIERVPLVGLGEAEKRASMAVAAPWDPHLVGYRLFRLMAREVPADDLVRLAVDHAGSLTGLLDDPAVAGAVAGAPPGVDRSFPLGPTRYLVPQVTFEIDGITPLVTGRRVIAPEPPSAPGNP